MPGLQSKKQIITIAGRPGSGKSSTAKAVAKRLDFKHFSSGDLFRAIGKERGFDVLQTNLAAETNLEINQLVDGKLREIGKTGDRMVIDSRTAWHWIPGSFKVFLDLDVETSAKRILDGMDASRQKSENAPTDHAAYIEVLKRRLESENRQYKNQYSIDPYDMSNYDLRIDTATNNLEEVVSQIIQKFHRWQS